MNRPRLMRDRNELPAEGSEYWERLASRIDAAVAGRGARSELVWLGAHGTRVGMTGVAAAMVLLAWVLTRPVSGGSPSVMNSAPPAAWRQSISPSDSLGRTLAVDRPPALGAVILAASRSGAGLAERGP